MKNDLKLSKDSVEEDSCNDIIDKLRLEFKETVKKVEKCNVKLF